MLCDSHTHSLFSFDGTPTVSEMCLSAIRSSVFSIAVTDHCDIDGITDGFYPTYHAEEQKEAVLAAREEYGSRVQICYGVELGQPHLRQEAAEKLLREQSYDFVIGSLHNLPDMPDFYFLNYREMPQELIDSLFRRNILELTKIAAFPGIDTLGHITYPLRYIRQCGRDIEMRRFEDDLRTLFETMILHHTALEVNTKMLREGSEQDPPESNLWLYRESGGTLVTVGSDAHRAEDIGAGVAEACRMLCKLGFERLIVPSPFGKTTAAIKEVAK